MTRVHGNRLGVTLLTGRAAANDPLIKNALVNLEAVVEQRARTTRIAEGVQNESADERPDLQHRDEFSPTA